MARSQGVPGNGVPRGRPGFSPLYELPNWLLSLDLWCRLSSMGHQQGSGEDRESKRLVQGEPVFWTSSDLVTYHSQNRTLPYEPGKLHPQNGTLRICTQ